MKTKQRRRWAILALLIGGALPDSALAMRQYAAKQQRFLQRDPLGNTPPALALAHWDGLNGHACVRSSPAHFCDPSGRQTSQPSSQPCPCPRLTDKAVPCCDGNGNCVACLPTSSDARTQPVRECMVQHELVHCRQVGGAGPNANCWGQPPNSMPGTGECWTNQAPAPGTGTGGSGGGGAHQIDVWECAAHTAHLACIQQQLSLYCFLQSSAECQELQVALQHVANKRDEYCGTGG